MLVLGISTLSLVETGETSMHLNSVVSRIVPLPRCLANRSGAPHHSVWYRSTSWHVLFRLSASPLYYLLHVFVAILCSCAGLSPSMSPLPLPLGVRPPSRLWPILALAFGPFLCSSLAVSFSSSTIKGLSPGTHGRLAFFGSLDEVSIHDKELPLAASSIHLQGVAFSRIDDPSTVVCVFLVVLVLLPIASPWSHHKHSHSFSMLDLLIRRFRCMCLFSFV
ncbi:hypothetical protein B0H21DRAFT_5562 [Amylocystis lapponica]|nr:hypothetical protein B0H21DRAFT_5562 [Amylocystis lapponica]